jgi:hypothetical protein
VSATEAVARPKSVSDCWRPTTQRRCSSRARSTGQLSADEIAVALDELDLEPTQIDDFYHALEELHIEVVAGPRTRGAPAEEPREVSTDALQLFLKDIGKVDLLTAAQEVELRSASSAATTARSRRWSRRTCASSSRSRRSTATRACRSSI